MKLLLFAKNSLKSNITIVLIIIAYSGNAQIEPVNVEDLQMEYYKNDSSAGAVIMFDIGEIDLDMVHDEFVMKYTRHIRIKFFDESELEWADVKIPFYYDKMGSKESVKIKKAITYSLVNGEIKKTTLNKSSYLEEKTSDYYKQIKFALANVKPGSIVEYKYEIQSPFKRSQKWYFQYSIPVMYTEHKAELASFWQYKTLLKGYETPIVDTFYVKKGAGTCSFTNSVSKLIEYEYDKAISNIAFKDVPAFYYEENMKCAEDYISKVEFQLAKYDIPGFVQENILKTWEEVAIEYYDKFELDKKVKIPSELNVKLSEPSITAEEKTKIILKFVQDSYTWNGKNTINLGQSTKDFQESKIGNSADLNLYLIRLLKESGVDAYPVILSTSGNGRLHYEVPFINQFNYIVALVADDKGMFYCDATLNCSPYYLVPSKCLNGHGFLVDNKQPQFVELADISQTSSDYYINCSFNSTVDTLSMNILLKANGYDALKLREYLLKKDTLSIINELFPDEDNVDFEYSGNIKEEDYTKPISLNFTIKKEVLKRNNKIYFNPFICEKITENPFKSNERKYPVDYRYKSRKKSVVSIVLPQNYKLDSYPESKTSITNDKAVKYNFMVQNGGINVQAMSQYKIENPVIDATGYQDLKNIFNDLIISQNEYFVISGEL